MAEVKITVLVSPASRKKCIKKVLGFYKFFLQAPPENNKANSELISYLAQTLQIPQRQIEIAGGHAAKTKKIVISSDLAASEIDQKLEAACKT